MKSISTYSRISRLETRRMYQKAIDEWKVSNLSLIDVSGTIIHQSGNKSELKISSKNK
jgi:hypothetical protein